MADLKISQLTGATTPLAGTEVLPVVQSSSTKKVSVANLTAGRAVSVGSLASAGSVQIGINGPYAVGTVYADANWGMLFTAATNAPANSDYGWLSYAGATLAKINSNNFILESGNFVPGTAAKGVNFTANTPAAGMTSQLLNWYEQGTFTAVVADAATGGNTSTTATAYYTRVGNIVTCEIDLVNISTVGLTAGNALHVRGLPFASANNQSAAFPVMVGGITFNGYVEAYMGDNRTFFTFYDCSSGNAISLINISQLTSGSARIIMGFSYRT